MKSAERLAFEADRNRLRLEGRIVMARIMNEMEHELETIHENANERGAIPRVTLEIQDAAVIEREARKIMGTLQIEGV